MTDQERVMLQAKLARLRIFTSNIKFSHNRMEHLYIPNRIGVEEEICTVGQALWLTDAQLAERITHVMGYLPSSTALTVATPMHTPGETNHATASTTGAYEITASGVTPVTEDSPVREEEEEAGMREEEGMMPVMAPIPLRKSRKKKG